MITAHEIGLNLRDLRNASGKSQALLAAVLGLDQSAISRMEDGNQRITITDLTRLARFFKTTPGRLVSRLIQKRKGVRKREQKNQKGKGQDKEVAGQKSKEAGPLTAL